MTLMFSGASLLVAAGMVESFCASLVLGAVGGALIGLAI